MSKTMITVSFSDLKRSQDALDAAQARINELEIERDKYHAERDEARLGHLGAIEGWKDAEGKLTTANALLRELEWAGKKVGTPACPMCGGIDPLIPDYTSTGHWPDCRLAAFLHLKGAESE